MTTNINIIPNNSHKVLTMKKDPSIHKYDGRFYEIEKWLMAYSNMQQEINNRITNSIYSTMLSSENGTMGDKGSSQSSLQEEADSLNSKEDLINDACSKTVLNTHVNLKETSNNIKNGKEDSILIKNAGNVFYSMLLNQNVTSKVRDEIISEIVSNLITNYDMFVLYRIFEAMQKQFTIQLGIPSEPVDQLTKNVVTRKSTDKSSQTDLQVKSGYFKPNFFKKENNYAYKITKSNYLRREQLCRKAEKNSRPRSAPNRFQKNKKPYISASEYSEDSDAEQNLGSRERVNYQILNWRQALKTKQSKTQGR